MMSDFSDRLRPNSVTFSCHVKPESTVATLTEPTDQFKTLQGIMEQAGTVRSRVFDDRPLILYQTALAGIYQP